MLAYRYDLVDVGRQVLAKHATQLWQDVVAAFHAGSSSRVQGAGSQLLGLLSDMDDLLATHRQARPVSLALFVILHSFV